MIKKLAGGLVAATALALLSTSAIADPEIVSGPAAEAECFVPWAAETKFFKYPKKEGPYRIALANGYIANTWRIQMIKTAKAYAAQPDVAAKLKEFKVVSTGEDVAAQISAINNFIDSGYRRRRRQRAEPDGLRAGDQARQGGRRGPGRLRQHPRHRRRHQRQRRPEGPRRAVGRTGWSRTCPNGGKVLEVRGVAGTSVDRDRHDGIHETFEATGKKWDVVEVIGKWDDPTAQKVTADAIAVHKKFDGITAQGGDTGVVQAMIDAKHPFVPFGGETENGFRKFCAKYRGRRAEMLVGRHRPGPGGGGDQDGDRRARRPGRAAIGQAAAGHRRGSELQGRRRTSIPTSPTISSSATPSRPAASTSPPRKSWDRPKANQ